MEGIIANVDTLFMFLYKGMSIIVWSNVTQPPYPVPCPDPSIGAYCNTTYHLNQLEVFYLNTIEHLFQLDGQIE